MAITARMVITPYAQTALVSIIYNLNGYSENIIKFDLRVERPDIWFYGNNIAVQRTSIRLSNTGDGSYTFVLYPLPANTNVSIKLYLVEGTNSDIFTLLCEEIVHTNTIQTSAYHKIMPYGAIPEDYDDPYCPNLLTQQEKTYNAKIIYNTLSADVWSDSAIATILAYADFYGGINPDINMKYLNPYAIWNDRAEPWGYYTDTNNGTYSLSRNSETFGTYTGNSGDNTEQLTPSHFPYQRMQNAARNSFIQDPHGYAQAIPQYYSELSSCLAFLPVYKQHYIDLFDEYSSTKWYETNGAFTLEQYLDYLILYKNNESLNNWYKLFGTNSEYSDFAEFTRDTETPFNVATKFYNSLNKFLFTQGDMAGYVCQNNNSYGESWNIPRLAISWYDIIQTFKPTPQPTKKRKMPIWEYLRYTI